jgi:DhnA family fructose-bisphosphate aldolase class Ia
VVTVENYRGYLDAIRAALPACDGILASMQPLRDLLDSRSMSEGQSTYLSLNRTGLAGTSFELDDRLVASVEAAKAMGASGVKHMVRIDTSDPLTAGALELLGKVLEQARSNGLEAMVEALSWRAGSVVRDPDSVVLAAVVAHDMGAPVLKVPVPEAPAGPERVEAVSRVVESVGVPVLVLGGPSKGKSRDDFLCELRDAMEGGAAGVAIGRAVIEDADPSAMARLVADVVRSSR